MERKLRRGPAPTVGCLIRVSLSVQGFRKPFKAGGVLTPANIKQKKANCRCVNLTCLGTSKIDIH